MLEEDWTDGKATLARQRPLSAVTCVDYNPAMLSLLQVAQQIVPQIPPIQVTVQSPTGMPEWIKILISTLAGASITLLFEFLKPWLERRRLRGTMEKQLAAELLDSLTRIDGALLAIRKAEEHPEQRHKGLVIASLQVSVVRSDRFDFYYLTERPTLFEVDEAKRLIWFNTLVKDNLRPIRIGEASQPDAFDQVKTFLMFGSSIGGEYVKAHKLEYRPDFAYIEKEFQGLTL